MTEIPFRPFDVVTGVVGEDQTVVSTGVEIWRARRNAMVLLRAEQDKNLERGDRKLAAVFGHLVSDFQEAQVGELLYGYVKRWKAADGREHFIGVVETGQDYRDAGFRPAAPSETKSYPIFNANRITPKPRRLPPEEPQDAAERIADKMARAASAAVRGDA